MTETQQQPAVPKMIRVSFLTPVDGVPSHKWPVERVEDMEYEEYLGLKASTLAHTRPKFLDSSGKEINT